MCQSKDSRVGCDASCRWNFQVTSNTTSEGLRLHSKRIPDLRNVNNVLNAVYLLNTSHFPMCCKQRTGRRATSDIRYTLSISGIFSKYDTHRITSCAAVYSKPLSEYMYLYQVLVVSHTSYKYHSCSTWLHLYYMCMNIAVAPDSGVLTGLEYDVCYLRVLVPVSYLCTMP